MKPLLLVLLVLLLVFVAAAGRARDGLVVRVDVRFLGLEVLAAAAAVKRAVISNSRNIKCSILGIVVEAEGDRSEAARSPDPQTRSTLMGLGQHFSS